MGSPPLPFELAVTLNPAHIDPAGVARFATQAEANAAVGVEADRYAARYGEAGRRDRTDKRGYRTITLVLLPQDGVTGRVELCARPATVEVDRR